MSCQKQDDSQFLCVGVIGTDEDAIIDLVTQRSNAQRQEIIKAYKSHFGRVNSVIQSPSPALPCMPFF